MKLLKSTLFMIALLMMQSASARTQTTGRRTGSTAKKAPAQTTKPRGRTTQTRPSAPAAGVTFQSLMQKVRAMRSADVINSEGVFTDTFENMVQFSGLAPELMETLFQAARNLHLPLSGDSQQDISLLAQGTASAPATGKFAEYYDGWTTELKQDYLEERIQDLIRQGKTPALIIPLLQGDLGVKMRLAWKENNVTENILYRIEQLNKQIADTVKAVSSGAIVPYKPEPLTPTTGAIVPYKPGGAIVSTQTAIYKAPEFYDEQSTFVKQDYLNNRIEQLASESKTINQIIDTLSSELKQYMAAVWQSRGIKITPAKLNQLHQQIQQSVNELVTEIELPAPKLPTSEDFNRYAKEIASNKKDKLNALYELEDNNYVINIQSREFNNFVREMIDEIRAKFPRINKPSMNNALQAAIFIMPNPNNAQIDNLDKASTRIFAIVDDIWAQKK